MWKTLLKLHIAVMIAGGTGVFGRLISYDAFMLVYFRFTFAFVLIMAYMAIANKFVYFSLKNMVQNSFSGILLCLHLFFFYFSIKFSNISIGTITLVAASFFTAIFEPKVIGCRFNAKNLIFSTLVLIGLFLIFKFDTKFRLGIVLGIISAFFSSMFSIFNKKFSAQKDPYMCLTMQMAGGLLCVNLAMPFYACFHGFSGFDPNLKDFSYLILLSSVFTIGLYLLVVQLMSKISAFTMNLTLNLEPVYAILIAVLMFHEDRDFNLSFYAGIALAFLSVYLQNRKIGKE